jgi:sterol desaturase/sphingolipid hydroxylase (fatty acid hydroxylase superfamily)
LPDIPLQIISTLIISVSATLFILLERLLPYQKGQKVFREGFFNDFFWYTIFQSYILGLIIFNFLNFIYSNTNLYEIRLFQHIPVWCQLLFFVFIHDFYIYWFHRWQHKNKYLWRLHEAHHTTKDVDWLSGSRSHSLEILINQTIEYAPIMLLGAAPEVAIYKGMISALWGMFIHSNINIRLGWLQYFINGPEMHRWHHSDDDGREYENNYSTKFAIWDWIFKTSFFPAPGKRKPVKYGLSDTMNFPHNYLKQNLFAFRKFTKNI